MLIINASAPVSLKHRCTSLGFVDWGFLAHPVKWLVHPSTCPSKVHSYWSDFKQTCAQWLPNGCSKCLSTSVLRLSFHGELGELLLGWPSVFFFGFFLSFQFCFLYFSFCTGICMFTVWQLRGLKKVGNVWPELQFIEKVLEADSENAR